MKRLLVLSSIILFLSACRPASGEPVEGGLRRIVDKEAGVVCWHIQSKDGIDCLPIKETRLAISE